MQPVAWTEQTGHANKHPAEPLHKKTEPGRKGRARQSTVVGKRHFVFFSSFSRSLISILTCSARVIASAAALHWCAASNSS